MQDFVSSINSKFDLRPSRIDVRRKDVDPLHPKPRHSYTHTEHFSDCSPSGHAHERRDGGFREPGPDERTYHRYPVKRAERVSRFRHRDVKIKQSQRDLPPSISSQTVMMNRLRGADFEEGKAALIARLVAAPAGVTSGATPAPMNPLAARRMNTRRPTATPVLVGAGGGGIASLDDFAANDQAVFTAPNPMNVLARTKRPTRKVVVQPATAPLVGPGGGGAAAPIVDADSLLDLPETEEQTAKIKAHRAQRKARRTTGEKIHDGVKQINSFNEWKNDTTVGRTADAAKKVREARIKAIGQGTLDTIKERTMLKQSFAKTDIPGMLVADDADGNMSRMRLDALQGKLEQLGYRRIHHSATNVETVKKLVQQSMEGGVRKDGDAFHARKQIPRSPS